MRTSGTYTWCRSQDVACFGGDLSFGGCSACCDDEVQHGIQLVCDVDVTHFCMSLKVEKRATPGGCPVGSNSTNSFCETSRFYLVSAIFLIVYPYDFCVMVMLLDAAMLTGILGPQLW